MKTNIKHTEDLNRIVFEAIGEASMCWKEIPTGTFDSQKAEKVALQLIADIKKDLITNREYEASKKEDKS